MANRVIKINSNQYPELSASDLLVYADLNMIASPAQVTYKTVYDIADTGWLCTDMNNELSSDGYLLQDPLSGHIKITSTKDHINTWNAAYNREQRKKSHYQLEKNVNLIAIKQSIRNIFSWQPGERIINPEFGSRLRSYLYEGITPYNQEKIMSEIRRCFSEWEPRAVLEDVVNLTDVSDIEDNTVRIDIIYSVPSLNIKQMSYVYEFQKSS